MKSLRFYVIHSSAFFQSNVEFIFFLILTNISTPNSFVDSWQRNKQNGRRRRRLRRYYIVCSLFIARRRTLKKKERARENSEKG